MDVSDPSNFIRIQTLFREGELRKILCGYSFTDSQTLEAIAYIDQHHGYCAEPHGAIAYLGLEHDQLNTENELGIFLETAHPIKFASAVERALNRTLEEPESIKALRLKTPQTEQLSTYEDLKAVLLSY
jgi:threonine synthase